MKFFIRKFLYPQYRMASGNDGGPGDGPHGDPSGDASPGPQGDGPSGSDPTAGMSRGSMSGITGGTQAFGDTTADSPMGLEGGSLGQATGSNLGAATGFASTIGDMFGEIGSFVDDNKGLVNQAIGVFGKGLGMFGQAVSMGLGLTGLKGQVDAMGNLVGRGVAALQGLSDAEYGEATEAGRAATAAQRGSTTSTGGSEIDLAHQRARQDKADRDRVAAREAARSQTTPAEAIPMQAEAPVVAQAITPGQSADAGVQRGETVQEQLFATGGMVRQPQLPLPWSSDPENALVHDALVASDRWRAISHKPASGKSLAPQYRHKPKPASMAIPVRQYARGGYVQALAVGGPVESYPADQTTPPMGMQAPGGAVAVDAAPQAAPQPAVQPMQPGVDYFDTPQQSYKASESRGELDQALGQLNTSMREQIRHDKSLQSVDKVKAMAGFNLEFRRRHKVAQLLKAKEALVMGNSDLAAQYFVQAQAGNMGNDDYQATPISPSEVAWTRIGPNGKPEPIMVNPETGEEGPRMGVVTEASIDKLINMADNPALHYQAGRIDYEKSLLDIQDKKSTIKKRDAETKNIPAEERRKERAATAEEGRLAAQEERNAIYQQSVDQAGAASGAAPPSRKDVGKAVGAVSEWLVPEVDLIEPDLESMTPGEAQQFQATRGLREAAYNARAKHGDDAWRKAQQLAIQGDPDLAYSSPDVLVGAALGQMMRYDQAQRQAAEAPAE